jgi:hypothetical protein
LVLNDLTEQQNIPTGQMYRNRIEALGAMPGPRLPDASRAAKRSSAA